MINHHIQAHISTDAEEVTCRVNESKNPFAIIAAGNVELYLPIAEAAALAGRIVQAIAAFQAAGAAATKETHEETAARD